MVSAVAQSKSRESDLSVQCRESWCGHVGEGGRGRVSAGGSGPSVAARRAPDQSRCRASLGEQRSKTDGPMFLGSLGKRKSWKAKSPLGDEGSVGGVGGVHEPRPRSDRRHQTAHTKMGGWVENSESGKEIPWVKTKACDMCRTWFWAEVSMSVPEAYLLGRHERPDGDRGGPHAGGGQVRIEDEAERRCEVAVLMQRVSAGGPSAVQHEQHESTHFPDRSWSPGRHHARLAKRPQEVATRGKKHELPDVSVDYAFPGSTDGLGVTVLVACERHMQTTCAAVVRRKGTTCAFAARRMTAFFREKEVGPDVGQSWLTSTSSTACPKRQSWGR